MNPREHITDYGGTHLPENRRYMVAEPAAAPEPKTDYVSPAEVAEMAAAERLATDLGRGMEMLPSPFTDIVGMVRHKAEYAQEHLQNVIDELTQGRKHVPAGLYTVMVAIKACRKAVE